MHFDNTSKIFSNDKNNNANNIIYFNVHMNNIQKLS